MKKKLFKAPYVPRDAALDILQGAEIILADYVKMRGQHKDFAKVLLGKARAELAKLK